MRKLTCLVYLGGLVLSACGSDATDAGGGTGTLFVDGRVEYDDGNADVLVQVERSGGDVQDAIILVNSPLQENFSLTFLGGDLYAAVLPGYAEGGSYEFSVQSGPDELHGAIQAPDIPFLLEPDPNVSFDPHLAPDLLVRVHWAGDNAMEARVRTRDFDTTFLEDRGEALLSAPLFTEDVQEVEIERRNTVELAGGVGGSRLRASAETDTAVRTFNNF